MRPGRVGTASNTRLAPAILLADSLAGSKHLSMSTETTEYVEYKARNIWELVVGN